MHTTTSLEIYDTEFENSTRESREAYLGDLVQQHIACCDELEAVSQKIGDPSISPYRKDQQKNKRLVALVNLRTHETKVFAETKPFQSLPRVSAKQRQEALGSLVMVCNACGNQTLHKAVLAPLPPCRMRDLNSNAQSSAANLERFFRNYRRSYPEIELLFASLETPVVQRDQFGVLLHLHWHIIFQVRGVMAPDRWKKWMNAFKSAMAAVPNAQGAYVHDCGSLKSVVGACRYVTKRQDVAKILDAGEFAEYHYQINGLKLLRAYGALRTYKRDLKERGKRIEATRLVDGAGPLWKWTFDEVDIKRRAPRQARVGSPQPTPRNHVRTRYLKQNRHGFWDEFVIIANPTPGAGGQALLNLAGIQVP